MLGSGAGVEVGAGSMEPKMERLEEKRSWKGSKVSMKSKLGCKGISPG